MEFALFAFWIATTGFTIAVAASKRRSELAWLAWGFIFGPIALVAVGLMPSLPITADAPVPRSQVRCPDCLSLVPRGARVCRYCRFRLDSTDDGDGDGGA